MNRPRHFDAEAPDAAPDAGPAARRRAPGVFDADALAAAPVSPHEAPQPPDAGDPAPKPAAAGAATRSGGASWFWAAAGALLTLALSVAAWDFAAAMLARNPALGMLATVLLALVGVGLAVFVLSEVVGLARLGRVEALRAAVRAAADDGDRRPALAAARRLCAFYRDRRDMAWAVAELNGALPDAVDGPEVLALTERVLMAPLDARAEAEARRAARQVAAATAMIPHAVVDVLAALALNLRAARRIGAIYGGRSGWLGSLRLVRAIIGHVLATGAVSIGDDIAGPAIGHGALGVVSRRLGEGVLNGALTARVAAAAISVCRPMPFLRRDPPSWRAIAAAAVSQWGR